MCIYVCDFHRKLIIIRKDLGWHQKKSKWSRGVHNDDARTKQPVCVLERGAGAYYVFLHSKKKNPKYSSEILKNPVGKERLYNLQISKHITQERSLIRLHYIIRLWNKNRLQAYLLNKSINRITVWHSIPSLTSDLNQNWKWNTT